MGSAGFAVTAVLSGGIYLPADHEQSAHAMAACTVDNPAHARHRKMVERGSIPVRAPVPPATLPVWSTQRDPSGKAWLVVPRHAPARVMPDADRRTDGEPIDARLTVDLRPYQRAALDAAVSVGGGVVRAPCGAGKTVIGLAAIAAVGRRALVLVHTLDLAKQWRSRLQSQLGVASVGMLGGGKDDRDHPVVIATIQTLARWDWWGLLAFGKGFGCVVLDEAHHAPAVTFTSVLSALPARFRLGLTATPEREDGLTALLWWSFGREVYGIDHATLMRSGALVLPDLRAVRTGWTPASEDAGGWHKYIAELIEDEARHALLLAEVRALLDDGRRVLVLSERVEHCAQIASDLGGRALTGKVKAKDRAEIIAEADAGTLRLVCGTTVADEGLDIPGLDAVVLATPCKVLARIEQRIGRIMRPDPGKRTPVVVDLVDSWGPLLGQYQRRRKVYARLGIIGRPPVSPAERPASQSTLWR